MIRLAGTILLSGSAVILGGSAARSTRRRVKDLQLLGAGLRAISRELSYRLAPLQELLQCAAEQTEGRVQRFFSQCAAEAEQLNGRTFRSVWKLAEESSRMQLDGEDRSCLEALGCVLGRYDCQSQLQALNTAIDRLEERRKSAEKNSRQAETLYTVLGLTAGAFLLILLV